MIEFETLMKKEQGENKIDLKTKISQWALLFWAFARGEVIDPNLNMEKRMRNIILYAWATRVFIRKQLAVEDVIDKGAYLRALFYEYLKWIPELGELKVTEGGLRIIDLDISDVSEKDLAVIFHRMPQEEPVAAN